MFYLNVLQSDLSVQVFTWRNRSEYLRFRLGHSINSFMWDFRSCMHTFCTNTFLSRTCTDTPLVHLPHPLSHTDRDSYGETSRGSTVTPWRSVPPPNNILLYCTPQLYDKLALPDFTVFSCQREPEPVFSHQIVSNTERAHCAEQKASPVLSLSLLMYGTFFFFSPQPIGILRYDLMSSFMSCWGPCPKKNCFSNPLETRKISHIFITVGWRTQSWE